MRINWCGKIGHKWKSVKSHGPDHNLTCFRCGKKLVAREEPGYQPADPNFVGGNISFYDWVKSPEAESYRRRIHAGEKGNRDNPILAATEAYEAGLKEGRRRIARRVYKNLIKE